MATLYDTLPLDVRAKYPLNKLSLKWQERLSTQVPAGTTPDKAREYGSVLSKYMDRMTEDAHAVRVARRAMRSQPAGFDASGPARPDLAATVTRNPFRFQNPMAAPADAAAPSPARADSARTAAPASPEVAADAPRMAPAHAPGAPAVAQEEFRNPFVSPEERDAMRLDEADARSRAEVEDHFRKLNWAVRQALIIGRHFKGFGLEQFVRAVEDVADPPPVLAEGPQAETAMAEWQKRHTARVAALQQEQIDLHTAIPEGRGAERITEILAGLAKFTADTGLASASGAGPAAALGYAGQVNEVDLKHRVTAAATTMAAGKLAHSAAARIAPAGAGIVRQLGAQVPGGVVFGAGEPFARTAVNKGLAATGVGPEDANAPWPSLQDAAGGAGELTAANVALFLMGKGAAAGAARAEVVRTELARKKAEAAAARARSFADSEVPQHLLLDPQTAAARAQQPWSFDATRRHPTEEADPAVTSKFREAAARNAEDRARRIDAGRPAENRHDEGERAQWNAEAEAARSSGGAVVEEARRKAAEELTAEFNQRNSGKAVDLSVDGRRARFTLGQANFDADGRVRLALKDHTDGRTVLVEFGSAKEFHDALAGTGGDTAWVREGGVGAEFESTAQERARLEERLAELDRRLPELDKARPGKTEKGYKRWVMRRERMSRERAELARKLGVRPAAAGEEKPSAVNEETRTDPVTESSPADQTLPPVQPPGNKTGRDVVVEALLKAHREAKTPEERESYAKMLRERGVEPPKIGDSGSDSSSKLPTHYTRSNGEKVLISGMENDHLLNAERKAKDGPEREALRAEIKRRGLGVKPPKGGNDGKTSGGKTDGEGKGGGKGSGNSSDGKTGNGSSVDSGGSGSGSGSTGGSGGGGGASTGAGGETAPTGRTRADLKPGEHGDPGAGLEKGEKVETLDGRRDGTVVQHGGKYHEGETLVNFHEGGTPEWVPSSSIRLRAKHPPLVHEGEGFRTLTHTLLPKVDPKHDIEQNGVQAAIDRAAEDAAKKHGGEPLRLRTHQRMTVSRALMAIASGNAFVVGDGTGTGKSFATGPAIVFGRMMAGDKKVVIVVPNDELKRAWTAGLSLLGVGATEHNSKAELRDGVHLITYNKLMGLNGKVGGNPDLVIFDESHKGMGAYKYEKPKPMAANAMALARASKNRVFMSATPMKGELNYAYLAEFLPAAYPNFEAMLNDLGIRYDKTVGRNGAWTGLSPHKLERLHRRLVSAGVYSKTDLDFSTMRDRQGRPVSMYTNQIDAPITKATADKYNRVEAVCAGFLADLEDGWLARNGYDPSPTAPRNVLAERTSILRALMEVSRTDSALDLTRRLLAKGQSVALFVDRKTESDYEVKRSKSDSAVINELWKRLGKAGIKNESPITVLLDALKKEGVSAVEISGNTPSGGEARASAVRAFQSGEARVAVVSVAAGGTGLSLHDMVGDRPRSAIILQSPFSGDTAVQLFGRIFRSGSQSDAHTFVISGESNIDRKYTDRVIRRMRQLGAIAAGDAKDIGDGGDHSFIEEADEKPQRHLAEHPGTDSAAIDAMLEKVAGPRERMVETKAEETKAEELAGQDDKALIEEVWKQIESDTREARRRKKEGEPGGGIAERADDLLFAAEVRFGGEVADELRARLEKLHADIDAEEAAGREKTVDSVWKKVEELTRKASEQRRSGKKMFAEKTLDRALREIGNNELAPDERKSLLERHQKLDKELKAEEEALAKEAERKAAEERAAQQADRFPEWEGGAKTPDGWTPAYTHEARDYVTEHRLRESDDYAASSRVVRDAVVGKTYSEAALWLSKNSPEASTREMALALYHSFEEAKEIGAPEGVVRYRTSKDPLNRAFYSEPKVGTATFVAIGKKSAAYTVMHELVHAATHMLAAEAADSAGRVGDRRGYTARARKARVELAELRKFLVEHSKKNKISDSHVRHIIRYMTRFSDNQEMLAVGLTDLVAQKWLDSIPYTKNRTVFGEFVGIIRRLLGMPETSETALTEILRIGNEFLRRDTETEKQINDWRRTMKEGDRVTVRGIVDKENDGEHGTVLPDAGETSVNVRDELGYWVGKDGTVRVMLDSGVEREFRRYDLEPGPEKPRPADSSETSDEKAVNESAFMDAFEAEMRARPAGDTRTAFEIAADALKKSGEEAFPPGFDAETQFSVILNRIINEAGQGNLFGLGEDGTPPPAREQESRGPGVDAAEGEGESANVSSGSVESGTIRAADLSVLPEFQKRKTDVEKDLVSSGKIQRLLKRAGGYDQTKVDTHPVIVWKDSSGRFGPTGKLYVLDGHHRRFLAANKWVKEGGKFKTAGESDNTVPFVRVEATWDKALEIARKANREASRTDYLEDAQEARDMADAGSSIDDIRTELGVTAKEAAALVNSSYLKGEAQRLVEDVETRPHAALLGAAAKAYPEYFTPARQAHIAAQVERGVEGYAYHGTLKEMLKHQTDLIEASRQMSLGGDVVLDNLPAISEATLALATALSGTKRRAKSSKNAAAKVAKDPKASVSGAKEALKLAKLHAEELAEIEKVNAEYSMDRIAARIGDGLRSGVPVEKTAAALRAEIAEKVKAIVGEDAPGMVDGIDPAPPVSGRDFGLNESGAITFDLLTGRVWLDVLRNLRSHGKKVSASIPKSRRIRVYNAQTGQYVYHDPTRHVYEPDPFSESFSKRLAAILAIKTDGRFAQLRDIVSAPAFNKYQASHSYQNHFLTEFQLRYKEAVGPLAEKFAHGSLESKRIALVMAGKLGIDKLPTELRGVPDALEEAYHDLRDYSNKFAKNYGRPHVYSYGVRELKPDPSIPGSRRFSVKKGVRIFTDPTLFRVVGKTANGGLIVETYQRLELRTRYGGPHLTAGQLADTMQPLLEALFGGEASKAEMRKMTNRFFQQRIGRESHIYDAVHQFDVYHRALAHYLAVVPFFEQMGRDYVTFRNSGDITRAEAMKAVVGIHYFKKSDIIDRTLGDFARQMLFKDASAEGTEMSEREIKTAIGVAAYEAAKKAGAKAFWRVSSDSKLNKKHKIVGTNQQGDHFIATDGTAPMIGEKPVLRALPRFALGRALDLGSMLGRPRGMSQQAWRKVLARRAGHSILENYRDPSKAVFGALGHATHLALLGYNLKSSLNNSMQTAITLLPEYGFQATTAALVEQAAKSGYNTATWVPRKLADAMLAQGRITAAQHAKLEKVMRLPTGTDKARAIGALTSELTKIHDTHILDTERKLLEKLWDNYGPMAPFRFAEDFTRGVALLAAEHVSRRNGLGGRKSSLDRTGGIKPGTKEASQFFLDAANETAHAGTRASAAARIVSQTMFDYGPFGRPAVFGGGLDRLASTFITFPFSFMEKATRPWSNAARVATASGRGAADFVSGGRIGKPKFQPRRGKGALQYVKRGVYTDRTGLGMWLTEYGAGPEERKFAAMLLRQAIVFGAMAAGTVATRLDLMFPGVVGWEAFLVRLAFPNKEARPLWAKRIVEQADKHGIVRGLPLSPPVRTAAEGVISDNWDSNEPATMLKRAAGTASDVGRMFIPGAAAAKRAVATAPNAYELQDGGRYRKAADMLGIKTVYPSSDAGEWAKQNLGLMPEWERQQKKQKVKYTPKRRRRLGGLHGMSGDGLRGL